MAADDAIRDHASEKRLFLARTLVAGGIVFVLVALLVARVAYLQVFRHGYYAARSQDNRQRARVIAPVRGLIYDRNGVVLADNRPAYRLEVVPEQVGDMAKTLDRLAKIVTITPADRERFTDLAHKTPRFRGVAIRSNLSPREVARFTVNADRFPGVAIHAVLTRHYPLGERAAHLVGYVGGITAADLLQVDGRRYRGSASIGKSGVEAGYESRLHGYPGSRVIETDAAGRSLGEIDRQPPIAGDSLYLTIDSRLQQIAARALGDADGAVVAIDPNTGGILTLVSKPSFNPALFVNGISHRDYRRLLRDPDKPLFDRALQGSYPPGSTIKPVMALGALATRSIDPKHKVYCPGYIILAGSHHRYRDWKRSGQGWLDLRQAIYRSSDVYFYKLGLKLGIDDIHRYATLFGLGEKTGIDLPRENRGLMPSRAWKHGTRHQPWFPGETLNTVIGQGYVNVTPLQLAQMASLIAARGHGFVPHVLKAWRAPGADTIHWYKPVAKAPIEIKPKQWRIVIGGMRDVISRPRGTAYYYVGQHLEYPIAGKSGTAQVAALPENQAAPDENAGPRRDRPHALFIAFAPIAHPRIAVAVVVEHGGGGSSVAGPIARKVIDSYLDEQVRLQASNVKIR